MKPTCRVVVPEHVRAADLGPVTVIVNYLNGRVEALIGPAARWWQRATSTGCADVPGVLDEEAARPLQDQLIAAGLIEPATADAPRSSFSTFRGPPWEPSWGTQEMAAGLTALAPAPLRTTARAAVALAVVLVVLAAGRRRGRTARLIRLLTVAATWTRGPAPAERVRSTAHAVRRAGMVVPSRVACLEESAAIVLALASARQRVTWCHGVAADPVPVHAWVEDASGRPVAEPPGMTTRFAVLRTIPDRGEDIRQ